MAAEQVLDAELDVREMAAWLEAHEDEILPRIAKGQDPSAARVRRAIGAVTDPTDPIPMLELHAALSGWVATQSAEIRESWSRVRLLATDESGHVHVLDPTTFRSIKGEA